MKAYFGFDDTDSIDSPYGTGKLSRWFGRHLPEGCQCRGVLRQQLLVCDAIPFTSHNSAACMVVEAADPSLLEGMIEAAVAHIRRHAVSGSDPGLCVATEENPGRERLIEFGRTCTREVSSQKAALRAARGVHLSGHGGSRDGIIGAAAAVGLTLSGWSGRYIELGDLRGFPEPTTVGELEAGGIEVVSIDREGILPAPGDTVWTHGWVRPRRLGHRPVLLVSPRGGSEWEHLFRKRKDGAHPAARPPAFSSPSSSSGTSRRI